MYGFIRGADVELLLPLIITMMSMAAMTTTMMIMTIIMTMMVMLFCVFGVFVCSILISRLVEDLVGFDAGVGLCEGGAHSVNELCWERCPWNVAAWHQNVRSRAWLREVVARGPGRPASRSRMYLCLACS